MNAEQVVSRIRDAVSLLDARGTEAMGTWFLGPTGESESLLKRLVTRALEDHAVVRRVVYPNDPPWTDTTTPEYQVAAQRLETELLVLMRRLSRYSIPWYSYRYHAHMNWDNSLPAVVGYFGAMLYNQNNVAAEGSPVTTALEIEVARDLCRMVGYLRREPGDQDGTAEDSRRHQQQPEPWGHITCDGSVANIEALWAGRNLKLYPFAVQRALIEKLTSFQQLAVAVTGNGSGRTPLIELDGWQLLNLTADETLAIPRRLQKMGLEDDKLRVIDGYSVQRLGIGRYAKLFDDAHRGAGRFEAAIHGLAVVAPASCHYSLPKAATLLGLGTENLISVEIDADARVSMDKLRRILADRNRDRLPVATVVAVLGSTQESAVDPLHDILELRREYRKQGFDFAIHADAAWGGYFAAMLRDPHPESIAARVLGSAPALREAARLEGSDDPRLGAMMAYRHLTGDGESPAGVGENLHETLVFTPEMGMSRYVHKHLSVMAGADSITIDPHKAGFVPYPAGALCYRDRGMPEMVEYTAPIVYHDGVAPTVGVFGIEGSKPGAAAAAVWLSHRIIRPDQSGYGRILGRCIFNAKRLFGAIASMKSDLFRIAMLQPLTTQQIADLAGLAALSNQDLWNVLRNDRARAELFREVGPDLIINTYAVNPMRADGTPNRDPDLANALNERVFRRLSLESEGDAWPPVVITGSEYDPAVAGRDLVDGFRKRLGVDPSPDPMRYLLSTTADPWLTDAGGGKVSMVPVVVDRLRATIEEEVLKLRQARST